MIAQGTLPWQPIYGKIFEFTFIGTLALQTNIEIQFKDVKWQYTSYILCKYGEVTLDITTVETVVFGMISQNLAYCTKYLTTCFISVSVFIDKLMGVTKLTFWTLLW